MEFLFKSRRIGATQRAAKFMYDNGIDPGNLLSRHFTGDWGQLDAHDTAANNRAVKDGTRILSAYPCRGDQTLWIITEADRSVTTILLPEEY